MQSEVFLSLFPLIQCNVYLVHLKLFVTFSTQQCELGHLPCASEAFCLFPLIQQNTFASKAFCLFPLMQCNIYLVHLMVLSLFPLMQCDTLCIWFLKLFVTFPTHAVQHFTICIWSILSLSLLLQSFMNCPYHAQRFFQRHMVWPQRGLLFFFYRPFWGCTTPV